MFKKLDGRAELRIECETTELRLLPQDICVGMVTKGGMQAYDLIKQTRILSTSAGQLS